MPYHRHELCSLEQSQMLGDTLPAHGEPFTQLAQGLTAAPVQLIEQLATAVIGQGFKDRIHVCNMQPFGCIFKKNFCDTPGALRRLNRTASPSQSQPTKPIQLNTGTLLRGVALSVW